MQALHEALHCAAVGSGPPGAAAATGGSGDGGEPPQRQQEQEEEEAEQGPLDLLRVAQACCHAVAHLCLRRAWARGSAGGAPLGPSDAVGAH